ncbi:MAG TPA: VWA domain-containing protein, partial [Polyangiaceae bacterium]|nr:VWA domain-containing protein [Polyangiaceae bacterium]
MSELVVPFIYALRERQLKVGAQEAVQLSRALSLGLHQNSLDGFYYVARALLVHRESDLDKFDEAFLSHFKGVVIETVSALSELEEWLKDPKVLEGLTDAEKAAIQELSPEELRELLEQRLREQTERHEGGNRWIGTGGTSPFGTGGYHPSGISMRAGSKGKGGRSAMGMADARRYRPYRSDIVLDVRQIQVALRKLRSFTREGVEEELDIDATIDATASNGGELEIVLRRPRRSNTRVLLMMDVGGSMDPYAHTCSQLFS